MPRTPLASPGRCAGRGCPPREGLSPICTPSLESPIPQYPPSQRKKADERKARMMAKEEERRKNRAMTQEELEDQHQLQQENLLQFLKYFFF